MAQDLFDELGIAPESGSAAPAVQGSGGDLFDELGIDAPVPDITAKDFGYSGEMRADNPGFLESLADDLLRGWQRGRQGIAVMHNELKDGSGSVDNQIALSTRLADLERKTQAHNASAEQQDALAGISQAPTFSEAVSQAVQNPRAVAGVVLESLGMYAPAFGAIEAAGLTAGPVGTAGAAGLASAAIEYSQSVIDSMRQHGYNPTDPNSWRKALSDSKTMSAAREHAVKRAVPIGLFDAMTGGLAGKLLAGAKPGFTSIAPRIAGEAGLQAGGGAAGEAAAQKVSGDKLQPGEILMEGFAEIPSAVVEVPANIEHAKNSDRRFVDQVKGIAENFAFDQLTDAQLDAAVSRGEQVAKTRAYAKDNEFKDVLEALKAEQALRLDEAPAEPAKTYEPGQDALNAEDVIGSDPEDKQAAQPAQQAPSVDLPTVSKEGAAATSLVDVTDQDGNVDLTKLREYHRQILEQYDQMTPEEQKQATGVLRQIDDLYAKAQKGAGPAEQQPADQGEGLDIEAIAAAGPVEEVAQNQGPEPSAAEAVATTEDLAQAKPFDNRLKRQEFRDAIQSMAQRDLVPGGGITLVPKPGAVPTSNTGDILYDYGTDNVIRTPSLNPKWAQDLLSEENVSVKYVRKAVKKALAGEPLGVKQKRVVQALLDQHQSRRENPAVIEDAKQKRLDALNIRRLARAAKPVTAEEFANLKGPDYYQDEDVAGDIYDESAYESDWDGEARALSELARQADEIDPEQTERILERNLSDAESARLLWGIIENGQQAAKTEETRPGAQQPEDSETPSQGQENRVQGEKESVSAKPSRLQAAAEARREARAAFEREVNAALQDDGIAAYRQDNGLITIIAPSAKRPGKYQATRYNDSGILGDSTYNAPEEAFSDLGLTAKRIPAEQIDAAMAPILKAEEKHQEKDKGVPNIELKQQTQADLDAKKKSDEARQAAEKEAEQKAKADQERSGFVLTGSDSAVDQAEARGQKNLFDQKTNGKAAKKTSVRRWQLGEMVSTRLGQSSLKPSARELKDVSEYFGISKAEARRALDVYNDPNGGVTPEAKAFVDIPVVPPTKSVETGLKQGKVGQMLGSGEVVLTTTGRETTPFPKVKLGPRNTTKTLKAVDRWLIQNAIDEAKARGDKFNQTQFKGALDNPQQADKDSAEHYLFDPEFNFPAPAPITKPLYSPAKPTETGSKPKESAERQANTSKEPDWITIQTNGYGVTVTKRLTKILEGELKKAGVDSTHDNITIHFRDPKYDEHGGHHPVEIALDSQGRLQYVTDYTYAGPENELVKDLDFDFQEKVFYQAAADYFAQSAGRSGVGDRPISQGRGLYKLWQTNFSNYYDNGVYEVEVRSDSAARESEAPTKVKTEDKPAASEFQELPLPSYIERMSSHDYDMYDIEKVKQDAKTPQFDAVFESLKPDARGEITTLEMSLSQLASWRDSIDKINGRLWKKAGRVSVKKLIDTWRKYNSGVLALEEWIKKNPDRWEAYKERQKTVKSLKPGDNVLLPYYTYDNPHGAPAKIVRKNKKNWTVEESNGEKHLLPPTVLAPTDEESTTGGESANGKQLSSIRVKIQAIDENGNEVEITRRADIVLNEIDSRLDALKSLWRCLH